jgi:hypothetical protein
MPTMKSFAEAFFTRFGAQIEPGEDELVVDLPPELASAFGKPRLYLIFPRSDGERRDLSPTEDLLVYGSRTFDQMLSLLQGRGEVAHLGLPVQFSVEPDQAPPLTLTNCRVVQSQVENRAELFYLVNFRAIYTSDEKLEEFMTVVLNAAGELCSDRMAALIHKQVLSSPDQSFQVEPKTLRLMLERAGEAARSQAEARATQLETALRGRLQKALLRLTTFYRRLSTEVNSGDTARDETVRTDLQRELSRKIGDELERHRLRVTLTPVSCAVALVPMLHYRLNLATGHSRQALTITRNLYSGELEPLPCYHCRQPLDHLALCDRGHPVHTGCRDTCSRCDQEVCRACGIDACAICGSPVCGNCTAVCAHCQRWLCASHVDSCGICGQLYCTEHSFRCRWCEQAYCSQCGVNGECKTCRQALTGPLQQAGPGLGRIEPDSYEWRQAENKSFVIHIGQRRGPGLLAPLLERIIIVTDQAGSVLHQRRIGAFQRLKTIIRG